VTTVNRRKDVRLAIAIPVRVVGHTASGQQWEELTKCEDASIGGASFLLRSAVRRGNILHLSLPLPKRYRRYDPTAATYQIYGLVEAAKERAEGLRVGVAFLGRKPPTGFDQTPGAIFLPERRQGRRGEVFLKVKLSKGASADEPTVLENFGVGGARVVTSQPFDEGEIVQIEDAEGSFKTRAEVRSVQVGKDGVRRLNLRFISG
jgi:PilZ domain